MKYTCITYLCRCPVCKKPFYTFVQQWGWVESEGIEEMKCMECEQLTEIS